MIFEGNCFFSPDYVNSLTSDLPYIDRRMPVRFVFFSVGSSGAIEGNCLYLISHEIIVNYLPWFNDIDTMRVVFLFHCPSACNDLHRVNTK
jgi:hypothetical protein